MRKLFPNLFKIRAKRSAVRPSRGVCLRLESLEDRRLLSNVSIVQTNLVSDVAGVAPANPVDPFLLNPWGLAYTPTSPFWVSDNNAGVSTLFTGTGAKIPLTMNPSMGVDIPSPDGNPTGGTPTGIVFNGGSGFVVSETVNGVTKSGVARFIWATEDGTIIGWAPNVDFNNGIIAVDNSAIPTAADGAVYKGLAIATDSSGQTLLYASNFRAGTVDVFGTDFKPDTNLPAGAFTDPNLPKGYAPFDIQELNGKIFVTYALQNAAKHDDVSGQGHGFVDMFNLDGSGETRVVTRGRLDSPWGLAIAPASFGDLAGDLLVGNFGNGRINAYSIDKHGHGHFEDQLKDTIGKPIQIDGLWALKVGNDHGAGSSNTLFFTAGINGEADGLFGSLQAVPKAKEGDEGDSGEDGGHMGGAIASFGRDAAASLTPAPTSAADSSTSDKGLGLATLVSPGDLQTFAPHHNGDTVAPSVVHASESNGFDWSNDVLVKELWAL
jgi:uncharacterized protein (TIGR03118 family)